jgi:hypothetical protein
VYANHGAGLFFVGVEDTAQIFAFALDLTSNTFTKIATIASGQPSVMDLEFEPETNLLWAACDDSCNERHARLDIAQSGADDGKYVVKDLVQRANPESVRNHEGFAIAPRAECVGSLKPVIWSDDSNTGGHALTTGKIACVNPPVVVPPDDDDDDDDEVPVVPIKTTTTPPVTTPPVVKPPAILPPPVALVRDLVKPAFSGLRASRKQVVFSLSEPARVAVTIEKRSGRRFKRLKAFTVPGKRGSNTVLFKGRVSAAKLRRGRLRITVKATDAAGNTSQALRKNVP